MKGETNGHCDPNSHLEQDLCIHIFTVSSAMVGVCLTVIGLIRVVITLGNADTVGDDFLAADALLFLVSCLLSYWALRSRGLRRMHRLEKNRRCNIHRRHDRNGDHLCSDYLHHFYSAPTRHRLEDFFENPYPVFPKNFFDLIVAETALDQSAGEIARVRVVP